MPSHCVLFEKKFTFDDSTTVLWHLAYCLKHATTGFVVLTSNIEMFFCSQTESSRRWKQWNSMWIHKNDSPVWIEHLQWRKMYEHMLNFFHHDDIRDRNLILAKYSVAPQLNKWFNINHSPNCSITKWLQHYNLGARGEIVMLKRKQVGNPRTYFDKNFADYEAGFESKGNIISFMLEMKHLDI